MRTFILEEQAKDGEAIGYGDSYVVEATDARDAKLTLKNYLMVSGNRTEESVLLEMQGITACERTVITAARVAKMFKDKARAARRKR